MALAPSNSLALATSNGLADAALDQRRALQQQLHHISCLRVGQGGKEHEGIELMLDVPARAAQGRMCSEDFHENGRSGTTIGRVQAKRPAPGHSLHRRGHVLPMLRRAQKSVEELTSILWFGEEPHFFEGQGDSLLVLRASLITFPGINHPFDAEFGF
mmetsp:Transcript_55266/g.165619  ORF Transcript_55266/g.165619 Transcript_55266/m.165619 type:complete len:158 (-) Transcript_55266:220-693(-)